MLTASPGDRILRYRLIRKIGEGGMGVVYEAEDTRLGRTVAIKLLQPSISENDEVRQRFLREARAASALDHPNLCTIYTVEEMPDGALLLVMAYYRGQTVADLIKKIGRMDAERIRDIGRQAAAGLHVAHMSGIVHRDIKPGNIFILQSGTVKILDFGLSRIANQSQLTKPQQVMGTLAYMPPEQLAGDMIDHRADIWALGVVLYEMAVGHPPFRQSTTAATISAITECRYVPLSLIRTDLPKSIVMAVDGALRLSRNERHSSAADLLSYLEDGAVSMPLRDFESPGFAPPAPAVSTDSSANFAPTEMVAPGSGLDSGLIGASGAARGSDSQLATGISIAVLPFRNVSADAENEYFSDGLTDELISSMGRMSGLRVVSRTSAFSFKETTKTIREIGEALNVEVILEGSVRRSGTRLRVTTQLTQVRDGFPLWSERFDRQMSDVFELQEELASCVVGRLRDSQTLDLHVSHLQFRTPMHADAYEAYLKGRYHWNRRTAEDIQLAGRYFERALQLDSNSAAAHAGMGDFYCLQGTFGGMPPDEAWSLARSSALRAIALDPKLPDGHLALASVLNFYDRDWDKARFHMERAIELHPQRGESYYMYACYLGTQGHLEEALKQTKTGLKFDPLSSPLLAAEALFHAYLGDYDTSILLAQAALQSSPNYVELYYALGMAQTFAGRAKEAVETLEKGIEVTQVPLLMGWLAEAYVQSGKREKAQEVLTRLLEFAENGQPMFLPLAIAATALGNKELALDWLSKGVAHKDILVTYLTVIPNLQPLHDEPRYKELVEGMRLSHPSTHRRRYAARQG